MIFSDFKKAVSDQFTKMAEADHLFISKIPKDVLWDTYLSSFPEGSNPIYRERTEHDCNCCKQFIRAVGGVLAIKGNKLLSIWDINIGGHYQVVADALSTASKKAGIENIFLHDTQKVGTDSNISLIDGETKVFNHFYQELPKKFVSQDIGVKLGERRADFDVLKRSVEEIDMESANIVLDLILQNSLYRGEEHKKTVLSFIKAKESYTKAKNKTLWLWKTSSSLGFAGRFKNTVIGTLLHDLSTGVELEKAVASFESKVAPANYKRSKAIATKSMIEKAQKDIEALGLTDSLYRRHAHLSDISINNLLYANRDVQKALTNSPFDDLIKEVPVKTPNLDKVEEVKIDDFVSNILPHAEGLSLLVEGRHTSNLVSLIAPENSDAKPLLKWGNNFSWAYRGGVTDSMKERVKALGGKVDGVLRFSIQWNEELEDRLCDLDAHCRTPHGGHIYFGAKFDRMTKGVLDVDITSPGNGIAVENITWAKEPMEGEYSFWVKNYSTHLCKKGFTAELEYKGEVYTFDYPHTIGGKRDVNVVKISIVDGQLKILESIAATRGGRGYKEWDVNTNTFVKVKAICKSPNHWDDKEEGNKHYFFLLDGCKNPEPINGLYNEFLDGKLTPHRKTLEMLSNKLLVEPSEDQLSGVGFSTTQRNSILCKVEGSFNRVVKVVF